jgi:hypothetical protein
MRTLAGGVLFVAFFGRCGRRRRVPHGLHLEQRSAQRTWGMKGDIPYLWTPGDSRCQAPTLTRYVLGKVGIMEDLDR